MSSELTASSGLARSARFIQWSRLIAVTGSAQLAIQAIGMACGILVIRLLSPQEYALYTLANTMLGTMTLLADGGIASGVMSQGGKVWQDRAKLGAVLVTGMKLRKQFAVFSFVVAAPLLLVLLQRHCESWLMSTAIVLAIIPSFLSALSGTLLQVVPKLTQNVLPLQRAQVSTSAGRLVLNGLLLTLFPFAAVAVLASGMAQIYLNVRLRKMSADSVDRFQPEDAAVRVAILSIVKRILPGAIYYSFSAQITLWLISIFGSTEAVAQIGALGRLAVVLTIFSTLFGTLVVPRFARLPECKKLLLTRYFQIQLGFMALGMFIVGFVWLFPTEVLWILGSDYAGLKSEVVLMIIGSVLNLMAGACFGLSSSRGVVAPPYFSVPYSIALQLITILLVDLSVVNEVLLIGIVGGLGQALLHSIYFAHSQLRS
ncbi:hypothetical protein [Novipirellula sp.]|uniref:hypothetical protein n=1 Tax=Novipirellula sp. TaxID=2795430 RepID=UPI003567687B